MPGENVNSELVASISKADGKALAALIQAVGAKRIDATPELMKALSNSDASHPAFRTGSLRSDDQAEGFART